MADGGKAAHSTDYIGPDLANLDEATRLRKAKIEQLKAEIEQLKADMAMTKSENDSLLINFASLQARHESQVRAMVEIDKRFAEAQGEFDTFMKQVYDLQKNDGMTAHINESVEFKNGVQQIMAVIDELSMKWVKISTEMAETKLRAIKNDIESMKNINQDLRAEKKIHEAIQHLTGKLNEFEQFRQQIADTSDACAGTGPCDLCGGSDVNL